MKEPTFNNERHFHMSDEYERHSSSQQTIGQAVIESTAAFANSNLDKPKEVNVLDLACGPGNLTIELKKSLEHTLTDTTINVTGLDYTQANVSRLVQNSNEDIQGIAGSFYELPIKPGSVDIVTSNEGLHWQPPYEMNEIIYTHLNPEERERYESWAKDNFKKAIKNIFDSLSKGGIAVLQFGHEGQLQKLWDLIRDTLDEERFKGYKSNVNFPLYYPTTEDIKNAFEEAGFNEENIDINEFNQDLTEESPEAITEFLKAFTKPGFSTFFDQNDLEDFYSSIRKKLSELDVDDFRRDQWHRTLIKVKKPPENIDAFSILARLNHIEAQEIDQLRGSVQPYQLSNFDRIPAERKDILALLNSCSDEELIILLTKEGARNTKSLGLHNIRRHVQILIALTRNPRFANIARQAENNRKEEI